MLSPDDTPACGYAMAWEIQAGAWTTTWQASCACGWKGSITADKRESDDEARHHRARAPMTRDDLQWMSGTGRYAQ